MLAFLCNPPVILSQRLFDNALRYLVEGERWRKQVFLILAFFFTKPSKFNIQWSDTYLRMSSILDAETLLSHKGAIRGGLPHSTVFAVR